MNPMQMKTPAERKLIAIKSHATRRANKEAEKRMRAETHAQAIGLKDEIAELERQRDALQMPLYIHVLSPHLNGNMCNGAKLAPIALDKLLSA